MVKLFLYALVASGVQIGIFYSIRTLDSLGAITWADCWFNGFCTAAMALYWRKL